MMHPLFLISCSVPLTCSSMYNISMSVWQQVENSTSYGLTDGGFFFLCNCKSRMEGFWYWFGYLTVLSGTRLFSLCIHHLNNVCHFLVTRWPPQHRVLTLVLPFRKVRMEWRRDARNTCPFSSGSTSFPRSPQQTSAMSHWPALSHILLLLTARKAGKVGNSTVLSSLE